jgi:membrane dipeptidase
MSRVDGPRIVDAHNDLLLELAFRGLQQGEPNPFERYWLTPLKRGGVALQVCPVSTELVRLPEGGLRQALAQVAAFNRAVRENADDVVPVRSRGDIEKLAGDARIGLMLSVEGAEPLGYDPWMVEVMWDLGVRMLGLTWNRRNPFADGAAEDGVGGLSRLGQELVDLCAELGIVIDLAHASERTFWDVIERSDGANLIVSHAGCRSVFEHTRNLRDVQLAALAARGGVLGVMQHPLILDPAAWSIDGVIDHVDHAVDVMGIDQVGLGGDFTRQVVRAIGWAEPPDALLPHGMTVDAAVDDLAGPEDYPNLVAGLRRRGYDGDRLERVLGGNLIALLERALPAT